MLTLGGFDIGLLLLGIGLWRARVVPRWAAAGIVLAIVLVIIGVVIIDGGPIILLVVFAGLAISLGAIGWTVLRMSDGDWERLPEQGG
jgi:peptidoglycan/LPS O-acetylase OafA/YrhL